MERRITEEHITKQLLHWLETNNWEIISFDFPQSGTGVFIHPNDTSSKNCASFIPDIVAIRNGVVAFFENKDRFVHSDFLKVNNLKHTNDYSNDINKLLNTHSYTNIYYGVGIPYTDRNLQKTVENSELVDFAVLIKSAQTFEIIGNYKKIFE